ncbi:hypothetical protein MAXJ12_24792 [Mesorhizobium alhagi CCNWXJ12-2]|uniref:Uncharacterized protein n=1 Tax=Mesorhizobium alhagi CCNWXJ12-2 TaxID=1107882 RepID=H0HXQ9_9HYPH|nr:hypothetical protein MAXJ12_24792 [Mesorhizobium alhagi CCNWXJ12-2]
MYGNIGNRVASSKYFIQKCAYIMKIFVADLDENASCFGQQITSDNQPVPQIAEV